MTIDQILSSASNLLVLVWVAHALQPGDFGRFSLLFFGYTFCIGPVRYLLSWPVLVHPEDADARPRSILGAALKLAGIIALVVLAVAAAFIATGSALGWPCLVLGLALPLLVVQDTGRYLAIAQAKPGRAVWLDALWVLVMIGAFVCIALVGANTLTWVMAGWAGTGAVAGLWVFLQYGVPRRGEMSFAWVRKRWDFLWRSLVAGSSSDAVMLVGSALVAVVAGPVTVAAVRAALVLERPASTVLISVATSTATDIARYRTDRAALLRHQRRAVTIAAVVAAANLALLLVLPDALGRLVMGGVWPLVKPLMLAVGCKVVAASSQAGVRAALMGQRQIRSVMVVDVVGTLSIIGGLVIGAAVGDSALSALWGAVIGQATTSCLWWLTLLRFLSRWGGSEQISPPATISA